MGRANGEIVVDVVVGATVVVDDARLTVVGVGVGAARVVAISAPDSVVADVHAVRARRRAIAPISLCMFRRY